MSYTPQWNPNLASCQSRLDNVYMRQETVDLYNSGFLKSRISGLDKMKVF